MSPSDRDYFALRAQQELAAAAHTCGNVRGRHEELAWLYQMRVIYFDRGITGEEEEERPLIALSDHTPEPPLELVQQIAVPA